MGKEHDRGETLKPFHGMFANAFSEFRLLGFALIETSLKPIACEVSGFSWVSLPLKPTNYYYSRDLDRKFQGFVVST